jgi:hypothetical protein
LFPQLSVNNNTYHNQLKMSAQPKFTNTQTLGQLAEQGIYVAPRRNPNNGGLFLVDAETGETIGAVGKGLLDEVSAMLTQAERTQKPQSMPSDWCVSDMETADGATLKCLHKRGQVAPILVSSKPVANATPVKKKF